MGKEAEDALDPECPDNVKRILRWAASAVWEWAIAEALTNVNNSARIRVAKSSDSNIVPNCRLELNPFTHIEWRIPSMAPLPMNKRAAFFCRSQSTSSCHSRSLFSVYAHNTCRASRPVSSSLNAYHAPSFHSQTLNKLGITRSDTRIKLYYLMKGKTYMDCHWLSGMVLLILLMMSISM